MKCSICEKEYPDKEIIGTSWTEPACLDCLEMILSEIKDAIDIIISNKEDRDNQIY